MKNKLLTIALTAACFLTYIACDDNKDEFLDEFSTILSFRNCDEIEVEVYNTGENGEYQLIVNKSGAQLGTVTRASIDVMDKALLEIYNEQNGKDYQLYPEDCYVFNGDKQIEFGPNDTYQTRSVTLITDKILESNQQEGNFVIPFILQNSADSINAERKYVFLKPAVIVPNVAFEKTGYNLNIISDAMDANEIELNLPAVFSVDNKWNFSCTLEPDESLLTEYNEKNGVDYTMLSEEAYTLSNEGKILFTAGSKSASLTVTVKRNKLSYGNYVLPLKMTQCSSPYFEINPNKQSCLFGISYVPDESKLHPVTLSRGMTAIHPNREVEGKIDYMFDGNPDTYYHSDYLEEPGLPHWIQLNLDEPHTALMFEYQVRHNNNNGAPQRISVLGSMDGITFSKIMTIMEGFPTATKGTYKSPVLVGKEFKHIRLVVESTPAGNSFALAELKLHVN